MKHTKLPWRYSFESYKKDDIGTRPGNGSILAASNVRIFGRDPGKSVMYSPCFYNDEGQGEAKANMEFIVHACNNHYQLIENLEQVCSILESIGHDCTPAREALTKAKQP